MSDNSTPKTLDGLLTKQTVRVSRLESGAPASDDTFDMLGPCRFGHRPQMMLSLLKCSGAVEVFPYSMLSRISAEDPAHGFQLHFGSSSVTIAGENMMRLFTYVCEQRAKTITESELHETLTEEPSTAPVVHKIEFHAK